jgi:hypothetical protein
VNFVNLARLIRPMITVVWGLHWLAKTVTPILLPRTARMTICRKTDQESLPEWDRVPQITLEVKLMHSLSEEE